MFFFSFFNRGAKIVQKQSLVAAMDRLTFFSQCIATVENKFKRKNKRMKRKMKYFFFKNILFSLHIKKPYRKRISIKSRLLN